MSKMILYPKLLALLIIMYLSNLSGSLAQNEQATTKSYNDLALDYIEEGQIGRAVQSFERGIRSSGQQRRVAKNNLIKYRTKLNLPAHTTLHFGWGHGVGKIVHIFFANFWLIISLLLLATVAVLFIRNKYWSWKIMLSAVGLAAIFVLFSMFRSQYLASDDLIIFDQNTELRDKPYDVSDEMQVVFAGQMGRIIQAYENYLQVQTDTYETGWVRKEDVIGVWDQSRVDLLESN